LSHREIPRATSQEAQTAVEAAEEFLRSHDFGPRRDQLDGKRDSVEPATDFRDGFQLVMIKI
jgi:hypothetical protein